MNTNSLTFLESQTESVAESRAAEADIPRRILRLEGAALLVAAAWMYAGLGGGWGWFLALLLVPDVSLIGYLAGPRVGAVVYNVGHSLLGPAVLLGIWALGAPDAYAALGALIWVAHIGMDRMFGYGLKYARGFHHTHLNRPA